MNFHRCLLFVLGTFGVALSGCGGGSTSGSMPSGPTPCPNGFTGTPPNCTQTQASGSFTPQSTQTSASLPAVGGYSGSITVPALTSGSGAVEVTTYTTLPLGLPQLQSAARIPQSVNTALLYFSFVSASTLTFAGTPGLSVTLPSASLCSTCFIAEYENGQWVTVLGPGTISGNSVVFAASSAPLTLPGGQTAYFALYNGSGTLAPDRPSAPGDTFSFAGTSVRSDAYTYPSPSPQPSTVASIAVTQNVVVSSASNPFGSGTVTDFNTVESDAATLQTLTTTTDAYYTFNPIGSQSQMLLVGSKATDDAGNTFSTQYTTPLIVDVVPEQSGQSWTNTPGATIVQNTIDGNAYNRSVLADGSYTENDTLYTGSGAGNYPFINTTYSDATNGTATFSVKRNYDAGSTVGGGFKTITYTITFAAPASNAISAVVTSQSLPFPPATPPPSPAPATVANIPAWFASGAKLYTETDANKGSATIPASCNLGASFGTTGNHLNQKIVQLDLVFGTNDTTTIDTYVVPGFGPVCTQLSDTLAAFYNYNQDWLDINIPDPTPLPGFFLISTATSATVPMHTTTINETLTLTAAGASNHSVARRAESSTEAMTAAVTNVRLQLAQWKMRERAKALEGLALRMFAAGGAHR
ncbi:MAG: hypothetical protein JOZ38_04365 [Candidatus Eremiobacteraeota bacterium]|nr:hypothetical protein [Candidatus Eremiobacteraeota bacterium]